MTAAPQVEPGFLELEDSWEAVNAEFLARDWTDGLPIVPPTEARVRAVTDWVRERLGWSAEDALGSLEPRLGVATVEKIAVNAVMAGCLPSDMAVLIAAVRAVSESRFNLYGVQTSTHNTSVLAVVNGPARRALDINAGYNVVGSRWRATAAIGRALRLLLANIGGVPGATNIHTQGHIARYEHCIAENEEENPWEPLHVERGFAPGESTVTVFAACPAMMVDDNSGSRDARDVLKTFAGSIAYVGNRNTNGEGEPLLLICPQHAELLAKHGYAKADVQRVLWEQARIRFGDIPAGNLRSFSDRWQKLYCHFGPETRVPIADGPQDIRVVVMGGKGSHSLSVQTLLGSRAVTVPIATRDGAPVFPA